MGKRGVSRIYYSFRLFEPHQVLIAYFKLLLCGQHRQASTNFGWCTGKHQLVYNPSRVAHSSERYQKDDGAHCFKAYGPSSLHLRVDLIRYSLSNSTVYFTTELAQLWLMHSSLWISCSLTGTVFGRCTWRRSSHAKGSGMWRILWQLLWQIQRKASKHWSLSCWPWEKTRWFT